MKTCSESYYHNMHSGSFPAVARRRGGGLRCSSGCCLLCDWRVRRPRVCLRACVGGQWTVYACVSACMRGRAVDGVRVCVCVHAWAGSGRRPRVCLRACVGRQWTVYACVSACMRGRAVDGVRVRSCTIGSSPSVVHTTHITSITPTTATATSPSNQLILEHFGGVDANSLCNLLNNNLDNDHVSDEPDILQQSSYYDDDSLNNLFTEKADCFSILSLNCQSLNAKFEQINIKIQQLQSKGHEFSAICLQETWLSDDD